MYTNIWISQPASLGIGTTEDRLESNCCNGYIGKLCECGCNVGSCRLEHANGYSIWTAGFRGIDSIWTAGFRGIDIKYLNEDLRVIKVVCKNIEHVCFLSVCRGSGTLILDVSLQLSKTAPSEVLKQLRFWFP